MLLELSIPVKFKAQSLLIFPNMPDIYQKTQLLELSQCREMQTTGIQNKSWLKLMPRAGLSAACRRVTHQNNPDSLIMYGLMCGSLPGTNNDRPASTSFATLYFCCCCCFCVCVKGFMHKMPPALPRITRQNISKICRPRVTGGSGFYEFLP